MDWLIDWLYYQVLSSLAVQRWSSTLATSACQSSRQAVALMTTTTSPLIQWWAAACPSCPLDLKLPWIPLRRPTSTTHLVTITTIRDKLCVASDPSVYLKTFYPLCLQLSPPPLWGSLQWFQPREAQSPSHSSWSRTSPTATVDMTAGPLPRRRCRSPWRGCLWCTSKRSGSWDMPSPTRSAQSEVSQTRITGSYQAFITNQMEIIFTEELINTGDCVYYHQTCTRDIKPKSNNNVKKTRLEHSVLNKNSVNRISDLTQ